MPQTMGTVGQYIDNKTVDFGDISQNVPTLNLTLVVSQTIQPVSDLGAFHKMQPKNEWLPE